MKLAILKVLLLALCAAVFISVGCCYLTKAPSSGEVLTLKAENTDRGAEFHAENLRWKVDVRYVSSLLHQPEVTVRQKNSWLVFLMCLATGLVCGMMAFHLGLKKARANHNARALEKLHEETKITSP